MGRCTRLLFRQSLTGSPTGDPDKLLAIVFSSSRKGLATGIVIGGFGSGALFFAPSMNYLMSKFSVAPAFLGSGSGLDLVTEGGRQFAQVGGQLQEVVYASASELARLPFDGLAEGFYLVGSGSTGVALAYSTMGLTYTAITVASSLALKRAPPGFKPQVFLHSLLRLISLLPGLDTGRGLCCSNDGSICSCGCGATHSTGEQSFKLNFKKCRSEYLKQDCPS